MIDSVVLDMGVCVCVCVCACVRAHARACVCFHIYKAPNAAKSSLCNCSRINSYLFDTLSAARSNQEQPGAIRSSQEQSGAARSNQEQPGAAGTDTIAL